MVNNMKALKRRLLAKTITYRTLSFLSNVVIIGAVTGSWGLASGVAIILMAVNAFVYAWHEHMWNGVKWGYLKK